MEKVQPSTDALREALALSTEMLRNIELSELGLEALCLKASRLARLLNDLDMQKAFGYESSGYPSGPGGVEPMVYRLAQLAGREYKKKDEKTGVVNAYIYPSSVGELESSLEASRDALRSTQDPNVSISSANPSQWVSAPMGNSIQRGNLLASITAIAGKLASRRALIHNYVSHKYYELRYSAISSDIFSRIRERADVSIGQFVPDAVNKFTAVYDNLQSENTEDWSNAVHSCRRILQDLADALFPPQAADRVIESGGKKKTIKLGADHYINRLIAFVTDNSGSGKFNEVVGSHISFIGDRLDSIFRAAQKGSHDIIVSREEADRYVVYSYLIIGDILSLKLSTASDAIVAPTIVDDSEHRIRELQKEK